MNTAIKISAAVIVMTVVLSGFWLLAVSPRLAERDFTISTQAAQIKKLQDEQLIMIHDIGAAQSASKANAEAIDRLAGKAKVADVRTVVVREKIREAAAKAGPQPVGAASRAYYDAIIAERAGESK